MISYKRSRKILKSSAIKIGNEFVKSSNCINRVSAENILCKSNNPAGNNAAFDGYALNSNDTKHLNKKKGKLFRIIGSVAAGDKPNKKKSQKFKGSLRWICKSKKYL